MINWHHLYEFMTIVAALLIVLDPLAVMPIILSIRASVKDQHESRCLIYHVVAGATILLLFFTITGTWVLALFGITLSDMRIGGGLLLLVIALRLVVEGKFGPDGEVGYKSAIVPIISPLIIGPGAITAAVVLAAVHGVWITVLAGVVAMLFSTIIFLLSGFILRLLGSTGTDLISRVMGVLIATFAVSYIRIGIFDLIRVSHH